MTCREKLMQEHPNWDNAKINETIRNHCPWSYGYCERPTWCCGNDDLKCPTCWNLDIPELIPDGTDLNSIDKPGTYILDSGDRTEFATGAVRDMREGKGRCDLMPLEVVTEYHEFATEFADDILFRISEFKRTGYKTTGWLYGAIHAFDVRHYNSEYTMFLEVAKHFEEGAKKYGENNWQKGIPVHCYIDSAIRHYFKWRRGDKDEPHDRAFVWNLMCCIWEVDYSPRAEKEENK